MTERLQQLFHQVSVTKEHLNVETDLSVIQKTELPKRLMNWKLLWKERECKRNCSEQKK